MKCADTARRRSGVVQFLIAVLALLSASNAFARQGNTQPRDTKMECTIRVRNLEQGVAIYASKHDGRLPPDLYAALTALAESDGKAGVKEVGEYARTRVISPAHEGLLNPPPEIDAPWVNEQSSYKYLGNADVSMNDIQEWGDIVIAHLRLDQGIPTEVTPTNPEGQLITLAFLDGHAMITTRAEAERLIAKSVATLDALRTGADAPPDRQAVQNLGMILKAIHAYAKAHDGTLPPDLGATLAYVPTDSKATATPKQRARIYLSPRAQKSGSVPDEPTPEWVNANTGYIYLGTPGIKLEDIPEPYTLAMLHARYSDAFVETDVGGRKSERVPLGYVGGQARLESKAYVEWIARESQKAIDSVRTGEGLPEWVHALRDAHLLSDALRAYVKAHDNTLPANVGDLVASLPERLVGINAPRASASARVFLSPRAELTTQIPEAPTPAWIAENSSFVYHGQAGGRVPDEMHGDWLPLLHGRVEEAYRVQVPWVQGYVEVVPVIDAFGGCTLMQKEWLVQRLADPGTTPAVLGGKK